MYMRIFVIFITLIALIFGILALVLRGDQLVKLILFRDFIDMMLPILGVGALIKYLCSGCIKCRDCHDKPF